MEIKELILGCEMISHISDDGKRNGPVTITNKGKLLYNCNYIDDIPTGLYFNKFNKKHAKRLFYENGELLKCYKDKKCISVKSYVNGVKHGLMVFYNSSGEVNCRSNYVNGVKHGEMWYISVDGAMTSGQYINGVKHGEFTTIIDEHMGFTKKYDQGILVMRTMFYYGLTMIIPIINGEYEGVLRMWRGDELVGQVAYIGGLKHGESIDYVTNTSTIYDYGRQIHPTKISCIIPLRLGDFRNGYSYRWCDNESRVKTLHVDGVLLEKTITIINGKVVKITPSSVEIRYSNGSIKSILQTVNFEQKGLYRQWDRNGKLICRYYAIVHTARVLR